MEYLKKIVGEVLIDIGRKLVRSSEMTSYVRYTRNSSRNKYNW